MDVQNLEWKWNVWEGKFHVDGKYLMCFQSETY